MKTLSVLIAACRAEGWIEGCIDAVLRQVLPPEWSLEILLGVDGCTSTLSAARRIQSEKLRILELTENRGPYVTFNTLMAHSSGDFIGRFDADDVMGPGYLSEQIECLTAGADIAMTWSVFVDEHFHPTSEVLALSDYHPPDGQHRAGTEGQFMMKRNVWNKLGGFQPWRCGADTDFYVRANVLGLTIRVVEKFLYFRRVHPNSLTAHPDTNHDSEFRKRIHATLRQYGSEYVQATRPLFVEPVTAEIAKTPDRGERVRPVNS